MTEVAKETSEKSTPNETIVESSDVQHTSEKK
jgi:hypothetical protein